jgi:hypothetical protein
MCEMNEADINNYISNPNTTTLQGFIFRVNYSNLNEKVTNEIPPEEITKINAQYNPKYFNLLLKISHLLEKTSTLKTLMIIDPEAVKYVFLKTSKTKVFDFNPTGQLTILTNNIIIEIESIDEIIYEVRIFSLDNSAIGILKTESSSLYSSHDSIFTNPENSSRINTKLNELYVQNLLNILMEDYYFFNSSYSIFRGMDQQLKKMLFGIIKTCNHALHLNEDYLYIGSIALISLIIENRLAHIYETENGSYNDDKTLGTLIQELTTQGHIGDIETPLNNFKDIRNNLIHYHRRTFNLYNSFIESIKYLGQFIVWCKNNGRI